MEIVQRVVSCPRCQEPYAIVNLSCVEHIPLCNDCTKKPRGSVKLRKEVQLAIRNCVFPYNPNIPQSQISDATVESIIGCTIPQFRRYIEAHFTLGMSWNNYPTWRLDRTIPLAYFNVNVPQEFYYCFNFRNYRPSFSDEIVKKPVLDADVYTIYKRNLPPTFRERYEANHST